MRRQSVLYLSLRLTAILISGVLTISFMDVLELSVQFSHSVVSDRLWPHGLWQTRPPCPSPIPRACSNSSSWWYHPTISSSVASFSSCLQSFPAAGSFPNESVLRIRRPNYWSFSFSISPSSEHSELISFMIDWLDLLAVQGTLKSLLQHHMSKASNLLYHMLFIRSKSLGPAHT